MTRVEPHADRVVAALYRFVTLENYADLKTPLLEVCRQAEVKGTLLLAREGINGTIAGSQTGVDSVIRWLRRDPRLADLDWKESRHAAAPFHRMKVKLKKEIVTMGVSGVDPSEKVGTYVAPKGWNDLIADHETIVIDARNDFEIQVGTFEGAINPKTNRFSELPQWLEEHRAELLNKKVAMFCTGGIRCEKATSYLKGRGVEDVFHLKGGILQYLENIPEAESRWYGECFVFDGRVSVKHDLKLGDYELCYACRSPVSAAGRMSDNFVAGVSCDHCIGQRSDEQRARYATRQVQIKRAEEQGKVHIGATFKTVKKSTAFDE